MKRSAQTSLPPEQERMDTMTTRIPRKRWKPVQVPLVHLAFSTTGSSAATSNPWTTNSAQPVTVTEASVMCTIMAVLTVEAS
jgi:hypothetical protein